MTLLTDTKKLRELAEAATQGDWLRSAMSLGVYAHATNETIAILYDEYGDDFDNQKANASYIAAANPAAIIALLNRLEAAEKDAARYRYVRDCNSGSIVIVQITGMGDDDQFVITEQHADEAIDAAMSNK